jgi:hypothetical protein
VEAICPDGVMIDTLPELAKLALMTHARCLGAAKPSRGTSVFRTVPVAEIYRCRSVDQMRGC